MFSKLPIIAIQILLVCSFQAFADSATQTDWSGGPDIWGPVISWGNEFYSSTQVVWDGSPGVIHIFPSLGECIDDDFSHARWVTSSDIDSDGDIDVIGASAGDNMVSWWENIDGSGIQWMEHVIAPSVNYAHSVFCSDIDGDLDTDVVGTEYYSNSVIWWENNDGAGLDWSGHLIDEDLSGARSACAEDIDGDGDMDVVATGQYANSIVWYENDNSNWNKNVVDETVVAPRSVFTTDLDGDGDIDILGTGQATDEIAWWENLNNGVSWDKHVVSNSVHGAIYASSNDIDGDGDQDVIGAGCDAGGISWWENNNSIGTSWTKHIVDVNFNGIYCTYSEDMDADGDEDILGCRHLDGNGVVWWENSDGTGSTWVEHVVDSDFDGVCIYADDIDGNSVNDVISAAYDTNDISWWSTSESFTSGNLESSILDTSIDPFWDYFNWTAITPDGTSISFQLRASDSYTSMGIWSDTLSAPCTLSGILDDGDRFVQYRVLLNTSDPNLTPFLDNLTISWNPVQVEEDLYTQIGNDYLLVGAVPNPAFGCANIGFFIPELSQVELSIYDVSGRLLMSIDSNEYSPGFHQLLLEELKSGIYFCLMRAGEFNDTKRFTLIE